MIPKIHENKQFSGAKILFAIAAAFIVIAGLKLAASILVPLLFGVFLAILGSAGVAWLQKKGTPKFLAVLLITLLFIGAIIIIALLLVNSANEFTRALPKYQAQLVELGESGRNFIARYGLYVSRDTFVDMLQPANVMGIFATGLRGLVNAISGLLLVLVLIAFMLFEAAEFTNKLAAVLNQKRVDATRMRSITGDVQKYLGIKTFTSLLTGISVGTWCAVMGIEFALLWGITAFLMNYIPVIGSIVASVPALLLSLVAVGPTHTLILGIGYIIVNVGISNFFEPILFGRRLGLSPLVVFVSLIFWGWVWGPAGMLLSVPLTMVVKILLEHSSDFKWIASLMEPRAPKSAHTSSF